MPPPMCAALMWAALMWAPMWVAMPAGAGAHALLAGLSPGADARLRSLPP